MPVNTIISLIISLSFQHVVRESNIVAGASRTDLAFDL